MPPIQCQLVSGYHHSHIKVDTYFLLEPAHGLWLADAVLVSDAATFPFLVGDAEAGSAQNLGTQTNRV